MEAPPQAILHWDRGALEVECDRAAIVQAGVEAYLGRAVFAADGSLSVRVRLAREGTSVVARVTRADDAGAATGERIVTGDATCASLDEPLTLVVALLLDSPKPPIGSKTAPEPEPEPVIAPQPVEPARHDTGEIQTAPSLEQATTPNGHIAFLGEGLVAMGALPAAAVGAGVLAVLKPRGFWGLGVQAQALAPQSKALGRGSLETSLLLVGARLCPLQGVDGATWWSACGNVNAARLRVESHALIDAKARNEWLVVPGLSARAGWVPGASVLLCGGLEALFPVSPDRYVYRDPEGNEVVAFAPGRLALAASVGVGVLVD